MKRIMTLIMLLLFVAQVQAQFNLKKISQQAKDFVTGEDGKLSSEEIIAGLKEALTIGSQNAGDLVSKIDGYYKNPEIFIPMPPEAREMEKKLRALGMGKQLDQFVETLNRAAEEAAKGAAPIFGSAIKKMTVKDGLEILKGPDNAATNYLQKTTRSPLKEKFRPVVEQAIEKVQLTKYWEPLATKYNKIPFVKKVNPDLNDYTTEKGLDGLFVMVAKEEKKIRKEPLARITDLLKKVFG